MSVVSSNVRPQQITSSIARVVTVMVQQEGVPRETITIYDWEPSFNNQSPEGSKTSNSHPRLEMVGRVPLVPGYCETEENPEIRPSALGEGRLEAAACCSVLVEVDVPC